MAAKRRLRRFVSEVERARRERDRRVAHTRYMAAYRARRRSGLAATGFARGEAHGRAKLTEAAVREIRTSDLSSAELARRFGVSRCAVIKVLQRQTWKHVE